MVVDGEADDLAWMQVDDGGQVGPAIPGFDVGDVAAPASVRVGGSEIATDTGSTSHGAAKRARHQHHLQPHYCLYSSSRMFSASLSTVTVNCPQSMAGSGSC